MTPADRLRLLADVNTLNAEAMRAAEAPATEREMLDDAAACLAGATAIEQLATAQQKAQQMHRRAQAAEAGVSITIDQCRREGVSLGRTLANAGYRMLEERAERAECLVEAKDADLSALQHRAVAYRERAERAEAEMKELQIERMEVGERHRIAVDRAFAAEAEIARVYPEDGFWSVEVCEGQVIAVIKLVQPENRSGFALCHCGATLPCFTHKLVQPREDVTR